MRHERTQPRLCRLFAKLHEGAYHLSTPVHPGPQVPPVQIVACRPATGRGDRRGCGTRIIDAGVLHSVPEGRVDLVIAALLGFHRPRLEHQMPTKGPGLDPLLFQGFLDLAVTGHGVGIVKPRPMHGTRAGFLDQLLQNRQRIIAPAQDQPAALVLEALRQCTNAQTQPPFRRLS